MIGLPNKRELVQWLQTTDHRALSELFAAALEVKHRYFGHKVHLRGLIEFSNICRKNCYYCGLRRDNLSLRRYQMTADEIVECAQRAHMAGLGSIVLQAGERCDEAFVQFVEDAVRRLKRETNLGITLCLGEQTAETYRRWFDAGAHRYLLRIETSSPELYATIHPPDHSYSTRRACVFALREIGYQVGTGVMIGLPGQTAENLADDILFFDEMDVDMIGMGPYLRHAGTPLAASCTDYSVERQLRLGLVMIALTRLRLPDVNIAATMALLTLHPRGREMGLKAGANIIMPNITPTDYGQYYDLYEGRPYREEGFGELLEDLSRKVREVGEEVVFGEYGDSPHYFARMRCKGATTVRSVAPTSRRHAGVP